MSNTKTKWDYNKALELRDAGLRYSEIARELGQKASTIQGYFWRTFGKTGQNTNTARKVDLSNIQKEVLFGGLLGDINLHIARSANSKNAFGKIEHCTKQLDYVKWKKEIFSNLTNDIKSISRFDKRTGNTYHSSYFNFRANPILTDWYNLFYPDGKKIIPIDLSLLTPLAIAVWFMDDGSKCNSTYNLATNCFTKIDLIRITDCLFNEYDIETTINSRNIIRIKSNSAKIFKFLIKPYVLNSFNYKL